MRPIHFLRKTPAIDFMRWHKLGFAFSIFLTVLSVGAFAVKGLNYGIDFAGGIAIEARSNQGPANLADLRSKLDTLHLGEASLQQYGPPTDVLIRLPRLPGDDKAQMKGVDDARKLFGDTLEFRSVGVVGPKVGGELVQAGTLA